MMIFADGIVIVGKYQRGGRTEGGQMGRSIGREGNGSKKQERADLFLNKSRNEE